MRSIIYALAWKEWHEHKWKLASITAILCGIAALILRIGEKQDSIALVIAFVTMCIIPLSVFVGLGAAASERSRRTLPFLQALPVPMWRAAVTKLIFGLATLALAILLTIAFVYACATLFRAVGLSYVSETSMFEKESFTGRWYLEFLLIAVPIAASFFVWAAAAGVNRRDEISAGAVALAVMAGWSTLVFLVISCGILLANSPGPVYRYNWAIILGSSMVPGGFLPAVTVNGNQKATMTLPLVIAIATAAHMALGVFYTWRFGRLSNLEVRSPQVAVKDSSRLDWLGPPRSSPFSAVIWKQFRESGPIALTGLAASAAITLVLVVVQIFDRGARPQTTELLGQVFPNMSVFLGFFVALVAGIGVCLNDVSPQANTFWRSRPIQPDAWFWIKFTTGLLVVLTSIYVPIGLLAAMHVPVLSMWEFPYAYLIPAMHAAIFTAAVAMTCLVRQAVYAAILSIATVYVCTLLGVAITLLAGLLHLAPVDLEHWWQPDTAQIGFGLALSFTICTTLAWLATRYDWGRKSRY